MNAHGRARRAATLLLGLAVLLVPTTVSLTQGARTAGAHDTFADPAFQRVWNHCDKPVEAQVAGRSWMWGPQDFYSAYEPYAEGPGGQHLVSYFDKSRMEINDPSADRNSMWFVTNGLLVVDMISGRVQVGDYMFAPSSPANIPVAGDQPASVNAPTYAALSSVASLNNDHRAPDRTGQYVQEGLGAAGNVGTVSAELATLTKNVVYEPTLGHNIPDVFWAYMNQHGTTYHDTGYMPNDLVVDWTFAMGYPITEPYWIQISVAGQQKWVMMQAFQRRILTYSPYNPDSWKVEMGNVGRAYYAWRYAQSVQPLPTGIPAPAPAPTATPTPHAAASIVVQPTSGDANTNITVTGYNFPAYAAVTISMHKSSANYAHGITTVGANAYGSFSVQFKPPADAAKLGDVTIVASANGGAVQASAGFRFNYQPGVYVSQSEVVANAALRVQGSGFAPQTGIRLYLLFTNGTSAPLVNTKSDNYGNFDVSPGIHEPAGAQFRVSAVADGGLKATTTVIVTVIRQPAVWVTPSSGPVGVNVLFNGSTWPANRAIQISVSGVGSSSVAWLPNPVYSNGQGTFAINVWIGPEYAPYSQIVLTAYDAVSKYSMVAYYYVVGPAPTPTPVPPPAPSIAVTPVTIAVGQMASITGSGWPAGAHVSLGVGYTTVVESLGVATVDAHGNFLHNFVLSSRWQNAAQLTLTAYIPSGPAATTPLWVLPNGPRVVPSGLPMDVWIYQPVNGQVYIGAKGQGWTPGTQVNAWLVSADGTLSMPLGSDTVNHDGGFTAGGYPTPGAWQERTDLGIKASNSSGSQYSIRYLPYTDMTKVPNSSNIYQVMGRNWPANSAIQVVLNLSGQPAKVIGTAVTDPLGQFSLQVQLSRLPEQNKNDIEITAPGQPYKATFDF